eukprot:1195948-Prorocentrum_minimum.AAC.3
MGPFEDEESVLKALKVLNKYEVQGQELLLNVNQETRKYLDEYVSLKDSSKGDAAAQPASDSTKVTAPCYLAVLPLYRTSDASKPSVVDTWNYVAFSQPESDVTTLEPLLKTPSESFLTHTRAHTHTHGTLHTHHPRPPVRLARGDTSTADKPAEAGAKGESEETNGEGEDKEMKDAPEGDTKEGDTKKEVEERSEEEILADIKEKMDALVAKKAGPSTSSVAARYARCG